MSGLNPEVVVVTGAAGGLGGAVARQLAGEGQIVVGVDLGNTIEPLRGSHEERLSWEAADISDEQSVRELFTRITERHGQITAVAHCAGILGPVTSITDCTVETFDSVMSVNARGTFLILRESLLALRSLTGDTDHWRSIVLVASVRGVRGLAGAGAYSASKHAVLGLMKVGAIEGAKNGIRVNAVLPGPIDTPMIADVRRELGDSESPATAKPEEVARLIVWLLSGAASFANGSEVVVDGGRLL